MSFDVSAEAYQEFMGRFSDPLGEVFLARAGLALVDRILDVGCGPGALTRRLVDQFGSAAVSAVDPSASFVDAAQARFPGVDVRRGVAEDLPYDDDLFDAALAQLVVHFMPDPVAGLREMGRVTRPGGVVAACVWDHAGAGSPLSLFWRAAMDIDPAAPHEGTLPGTAEGHLVSLATEAGLREVTPSSIEVAVSFASYDEWWVPYLRGVGPLGAYVATLGDKHLARLKERCIELLPPAPFEQRAAAWSIRALV